MKNNEGGVKKFYMENHKAIEEGRIGIPFDSKRQASKYLNGFGKIFKEMKGIPLQWGKRTFLPPKEKTNVSQ